VKTLVRGPGRRRLPRFKIIDARDELAPLAADAVGVRWAESDDSERYERTPDVPAGLKRARRAAGPPRRRDDAMP
jgi:hypothetical protein